MDSCSGHYKWGTPAEHRSSVRDLLLEKPDPAGFTDCHCQYMCITTSGMQDIGGRA